MQKVAENGHNVPDLYALHPPVSASALLCACAMATFSVAKWLATAESSIVPELPPYAMLSALAERDDAMVDSSDAEVIEADVPRSHITNLPTLVALQENERDEQQHALRRLLRAWCILRPDVGYSQGMNIIGALCLALVGSDEACAFTLFAAALTRLGPDYYASSPEPLAGFQRDADVLLELVCESVPALDPELAGEAASEVFDILRPWCCACFLPLWVGVLPVDCVLGVWELLFTPAAADQGDAPSICNVCVALAILSRCADRLLAAVRDGEDSGGGGFAAYPTLLHETRVAFSDPERLLRDARTLQPTAERLEAARNARCHARHYSLSQRVSRRSGRGLLTDLYEPIVGGRAQSKLTGERFDVLRRMLLESAGDGEGGSEGRSGAARFASGDGVVSRERLESSLALVVGSRLAIDWARALCAALGPSASALQLLTALACHVHAGLLNRLELIFVLHAGSRDSRLDEAGVHALTRTMLALSLAATDGHSSDKSPIEAKSDAENSDDDALEKLPEGTVAALEAGAPTTDEKAHTGAPPPSSSRSLRAISSLVLSTARLNLITRHAQRIAKLLSQMKESDGISLSQWREGCLSQPEALACFAVWSMQPAPGLAAPRRGAPHADSPANHLQSKPNQINPPRGGSFRFEWPSSKPRLLT